MHRQVDPLGVPRVRLIGSVSGSLIVLHACRSEAVAVDEQLLLNSETGMICWDPSGLAALFNVSVSLQRRQFA